MADEDFGEKTEQPTPHRRQESRQKGQVAKSTDLNAALGLLGAMIMLNLFGPRILRELSGLTATMLAGDGSAASLRAESMIVNARVGFATAATVLLPLALAVAAVALVANLIQVGFVASWNPVKPDFNKINPITGFGRLFSRRNLFKMAVNIGKVGLIGWAAYAVIASRIDQIAGMVDMDFWLTVAAVADLTFVLAIRLGVVLLVLAILDYAYARYQHEQDLRMSRQEVREELRRMEGDPLLRARRMKVARDLAMQRIAAEVPRADVVVTNPTHYAVALRYEQGDMTAPKVVAKGADLVAEHIRKLAIQHGVPIVRRAPLARALYATCEIGQEIPAKFYKAVAEVLAYVYELAGKGRRRVASPAARPAAVSLN